MLSSRSAKPPARGSSPREGSAAEALLGPVPSGRVGAAPGQDKLGQGDPRPQVMREVAERETVVVRARPAPVTRLSAPTMLAEPTTGRGWVELLGKVLPVPDRQGLSQSLAMLRGAFPVDTRWHCGRYRVHRVQLCDEFPATQADAKMFLYRRPAPGA